MRESDLTSIGDVWGVRADRVWPPVEAAPGVAFRRIPIPNHAKELQQALPGRTSFLVPAIVDGRAYYANLTARNYRDEDEKNCRKCNGAGYLRYERAPGHPLFGQITRCVCFQQPNKGPWKEGAPWSR